MKVRVVVHSKKAKKGAINPRNWKRSLKNRGVFLFSVMPKTDPRVDAYIARAGEFARPILTRIRKLIHATCPDVMETIKWSSPFYEHRGILAATPAFKKHCALIFWKSKLLFKDLPARDNPTKKLRRLASIDELPDDRTLAGYLGRAVALNEAGIKASAGAKKRKRTLMVPDDFLAALRKSRKALAAFERFSPSCQREYIEWIVGAKREETRVKRIRTAIAWIAQGKSRHWKYEKC